VRWNTSLEDAIRRHIDLTTAQPKPFMWTKTNDHIPRQRGPILSSNLQLWTLEGYSLRLQSGYQSRPKSIVNSAGPQALLHTERGDCRRRMSNHAVDNAWIESKRRER